jgi:hypothetical protein
MKILIFTLSLFFTALVSALALPNDMKSAIKTDNAEVFLKLLTTDTMNMCYDARNSSYTLLALTIKYEAKACFKTLVSEKADLEKACSSKTPLMYAVKYGQLDTVKALIFAGADYKAKNTSGRTAMDYAKTYEQKDIYAYLQGLKK